jgi:hypothetical protein
MLISCFIIEYRSITYSALAATPGGGLIIKADESVITSPRACYTTRNEFGQMRMQISREAEAYRLTGWQETCPLINGLGRIQLARSSWTRMATDGHLVRKWTIFGPMITAVTNRRRLCVSAKSATPMNLNQWASH